MKAGLHHLSNYSGPRELDAALFVAEDFIEDIEAVCHIVFDEAKLPGGRPFKTNIKKWLRKCPPLTGGF